MQTSKTTFTLKEYASDNVMLVRFTEREEKDQCFGLPNISSQTILMTKKDIDKLKELLDKYYADKGRNSGI
jgi:hypothetical protein